MQKTCFMFNKIEELLLFLLVLFYLDDKFGFANLYFNQFNSRNSDSTMFSLFIVSICPICISVLRQQDVTSAKIDSKSTSYMGSDGQHAPRTHKHCRPCGIHAHDTGVRAHTCLHGLFWVEHSYQPGTFQCTSSCNNRLRWRWIPQQQPKLRVA